jgi:2-phospho-L-lactate guanylyltransferase
VAVDEQSDGRRSAAGDLGVVVAVKPAGMSKSRLDLPARVRQRLARGMAVDTITTLADVAARLVVVSEDPELAHALSDAGVPAQLLPDPQPGGMNHALAAGAHVLREAGCGQVLACVGDLPALRTGSVRAVVAAADDHGSPARHFLADASGHGTTMLLATGTRLDPRFGDGSAAAHRASGAIELSDANLTRPVPDARADVDVVADLDAVVQLGVGQASNAVISSERIAHRTG